MAVFFGLDGSWQGWVAVEIADHQRDILFFSDIAELLQRPFDRAGIDIPIGLPDSGDRACDLAARALLRPHASRVFTGARRGLWGHRSHAEANRVLKARGEKMASIQLWNLGPKIMQVDAVMTPRLQRRIVEVHPELVFRRLYGNRPLPSKATEQGVALRRKLLLTDGFTEIDDWLARRRVRGAKIDDVLDACAVAIAVRDRRHCVLDGPAPTDARGLKMQIWY